MSCTINHSPTSGREAGTAIVEFSLMLPLFLLIIEGIFFFGGMGLLRVDMVRLGALNGQIPGIQTDTEMPEGYFTVFNSSLALDVDNDIVFIMILH